jgi:subtilase family serine protease
MSNKTSMFRRRRLLSSAVIFGAALMAPALAAAATPYTIANNTPKLVPLSTVVAAKNPQAVIEISFWLKQHNAVEFESVVKELYDPKSPTYRHWLDRATLAARYMPTADDVAKVSSFAASHGLSVILVDKLNMFVRVRGTVDAVQRALGVKINQYATKTTSFWGNDSDPKIDDPAGEVIQAVGGLESTGFTHPLVAPAAVSASKKGGAAARSGLVPASSHAPDAAGFTASCFAGSKTQIFSSAGTYPVGVYTGNEYVNSYTSNLAGCGYTPPEIQLAYNLPSLYAAGFDGTGQTIVIIDWCGSPTITADANAFSKRFGLPALTSSNFSIINYPSVPTCGAEDPEINIDVEWAHAIAPGAKITLLVPPSATFDDIDSALAFAVDNGLGNVISNSYGSEEYYTSLSTLTVENSILEAAAALGISADFSSGDDGDFTFDFPQYFPASVSAPADSPYATAVGGISLGLGKGDKIAWQAGWGNNETLLVEEGIVYDPPANFGFVFGSGGGASGVFAKPAFQSKLKGKQRLVPDISWLADPFTGAVIALSEPGAAAPVYTVYGGTSLAAPMFSALWAIANQEAGTALGLAASYVYTMPSSTILDVTPYSSKTNVTAAISLSATSTDHYTAADIAQPLELTKQYLTATWVPPTDQDTLLVLTFGTDSSLNTAKGWDPVTGVGVPNAAAFANYFAPPAK